MFFTFTTIVINFAFALIMVRVSDWTVQQNVGLLHVINLSPWAIDDNNDITTFANVNFGNSLSVSAPSIRLLAESPSGINNPH